MLQWWRDFWDKFLNNEPYFIARVRSAVMGAALLNVAFAHDFAVNTGLLWAERPLKVAGAAAGLIALLMRAGGEQSK